MFTSKNDLLNRITIEPGKMGGQPCIRGQRLTVYTLLGAMAEGMLPLEIQLEWPSVEEDDLRAACAFASYNLQHYNPMRHGVCSICNEHKIYGLVMPYASRFSDVFVCEDCTKEHLDPVLNRLIREK